MNAFEYTLQMRRFAEALDPIYRFFHAEENADGDLQYRLMCTAICGRLGEMEDRLLEVAVRKKFGEAAYQQALNDIAKAEDSHA